MTHMTLRIFLPVSIFVFSPPPFYPGEAIKYFRICLGKKNYTYGLEDKLFKVDHEKEIP
jgi:hypothetical protein